MSIDTERLEPPGQRTTLFFYLLLMTGVGAIFFAMIQPYLQTLLMGIILSVLLFPLQRRLQQRGMRAGRAAILLTLGTLLLVLLPLTLFAVAAARQSIEIINALSSRSLLSYQEMLNWIFNFKPFADYLGSPDEIKSRLGELAGNVVGMISGFALNLAGEVPNVTLQLVLALFAAYFFLLDGKTLMHWIAIRLPLAAPVRRSMYQSFQASAMSVFLASMAAAAVQSFLMLLAFLILSVPGAFLAAGSTFIFSWVPLLGSVPVWGVGVAYLLLQGSMVKAVLMLVAGLITGVSDNLVRPLVIKGNSDDMHPLLSLIAIFGGLAMFGIVGVFIGPILASMLVAILTAWPEVAREAGIRLETSNPTPDPGTALPGPPTSPTSSPAPASPAAESGASTLSGFDRRLDRRIDRRIARWFEPCDV